MTVWRVTALLTLTLAHLILDTDALGATFCCKDNEYLQLKTEDGILGVEKHSAQCRRTRDRQYRGISEIAVTAVDTDTAESRDVVAVLEKDGEMRQFCPNVAKIDIATPGGPSNGATIELRREYERTNGTEGNVWINGRPVCDDNWDRSDARVACRMLGFSGGEATRENYFRATDSGGRFSMDDVRCDGHERSLFDCRYNSNDDCGGDEAAGVRCEGGEAEGGEAGPMGLTLSGDLGTFQFGTLPSGTFCVVPGNRLRIEKYGNNPWQREEAVFAVTCNTMKVIPFLIRSLKTDISRRPLSDPGRWDWPLKNFIKVADLNNDQTVDGAEFVTFVTQNIESIFILFDANKDGSVDSELEGKFKSIPYALFSGIRDEIFSFFDYSGDGEFSFKSDGFTDVDPRYVPEIFNKFFNAVDQNKNRALSDQEVSKFLENAFTAINLDGDCNLSSNELAELVNRMGVPEGYGIAIKVLVDQYITVLNYLIPLTLRKADSDHDGKTTFEELMNLDDWDWFENTLVNAAMHLGYPKMGVINFLQGLDIRSGRWYLDYEARMRFEGMWTSALDKFLDQILSSSEEFACSPL